MAIALEICLFRTENAANFAQVNISEETHIVGSGVKEGETKFVVIRYIRPIVFIFGFWSA